MPNVAELIIVVILVLTCLIAAFITGYNTRSIRREIKETKTHLSALRRDGTGNHNSEIKKLEKSIGKLENELNSVERSFLIPSSSEGAPLSEMIRSAAPYIVLIVVGVIIGAVIIVLVPLILLVVLFTIATFLGSTGLLSEIVRSERKALTLSAIPAALYALTQIFNIMNMFDLLFWLFDIVVVFALIGVAMIIGRELPIDIVVIIIAILSVWDIYAVIFSPITPHAVNILGRTLFSVLIPAGTSSSGMIYALYGGGDLFFSYLLVTAFARKLKQIPYVLIGLITASLIGLLVLMYLISLEMAPALANVMIAALLSIAYYHGKLNRPS